MADVDPDNARRPPDRAEATQSAAPDFRTPPVEGLLAGLRLALGSGNPAEDRDQLSGVAGWQTVAALAAHHRVGTLFLLGLRNAGVRLPDAEVERTLARRRQRDTVRGMCQLDVMR